MATERVHISARIGPSFQDDLKAAGVSGNGLNVTFEGVDVMPSFDVPPVQAVVDTHDPRKAALPTEEAVDREGAVAKIDVELSRGTLNEAEARKAWTQARELLVR